MNRSVKLAAMTTASRALVAVLVGLVTLAVASVFLPAAVAPWAAIAVAAITWIALKPRPDAAGGQRQGLSQSTRTRIALVVLAVGGLAAGAIAIGYLVSPTGW